MKYKDGIQKKLEEKGSRFGEPSLEQIFYSPKINSCLYVEYVNLGEGTYWKHLYDVINDGPSSEPFGLIPIGYLFIVVGIIAGIILYIRSRKK